MKPKFKGRLLFLSKFADRLSTYLLTIINKRGFLKELEWGTRK
jgi:hypothetical protein